eukprot:COSAG04_NODE_12672_length_640_cov_1.334566_1_plen_98_part_01
MGGAPWAEGLMSRPAPRHSGEERAARRTPERLGRPTASHMVWRGLLGWCSTFAVGEVVTVAVGGKVDTSFGDPVEVEGTVLARVDGPIENCAPGGAFG